LETSYPVQRACPRVAIPATPVKMGGEWRFSYGYARNLSRTGMLIQTIAPINVGDEFDIEFMLPDTEKSVKCRSKVVWTRGPSQEQHDSHGMLNMGLYFSHIDEKSAEEIACCLTRRSLKTNG